MYRTKRGKSAGTGFFALGGVWRHLRRWWRDGRAEAALWSVGLLLMATMEPEGPHLFSLCPLDALGFSFCPGCGLGHAVAYVARGDVMASVQAHPLGIPAVLILGAHVWRLLRVSLPVSSHTHPSS